MHFGWTIISSIVNRVEWIASFVFSPRETLETRDVLGDFTAATWSLRLEFRFVRSWVVNWTFSLESAVSRITESERFGDGMRKGLFGFSLCTNSAQPSVAHESESFDNKVNNQWANELIAFALYKKVCSLRQMEVTHGDVIWSRNLFQSLLEAKMLHNEWLGGVNNFSRAAIFIIRHFYDATRRRTENYRRLFDVKLYWPDVRLNFERWLKAPKSSNEKGLQWERRREEDHSI